MAMNISAPAYKDFAQIAKLGKEKLAEIAADLGNSEIQPLVKQSVLKNILLNRLGPGDADVLERHLLSLASIRRAKNLSASDCVKEIELKIGENDWSDADNEAWLAIQSELVNLVGSSSICCLEKTMSLAYEHDNIFTGATVITDVRPVYDGERNNIVASIVVQSLRLKYFSQGEYLEIGLTLDSDDVNSLIDACENAKAKARVAKNLMVDKAKVETIIVGEND